MSKRGTPVLPHHCIEYQGEKWIEVEWPSDGRYDIGFQLCRSIYKGEHRYMGLFEAARFHDSSLPQRDENSRG